MIIFLHLPMKHGHRRQCAVPCMVHFDLYLQFSSFTKENVCHIKVCEGTMSAKQKVCDVHCFKVFDGNMSQLSRPCTASIYRNRGPCVHADYTKVNATSIEARLARVFMFMHCLLLRCSDFYLTILFIFHLSSQNILVCIIMLGIK